MMITILVISIATLTLAIQCSGDRCLSGLNHKAMPGPEPGMRACKLYSQSSCCFSNYTEELAVTPVTKVQNTYWNRCGNLSSRFAACRDDLTCTRNWLSDWEWDDQGNNCRSECIPFHQMYKDGKDLCGNMWGTTFNVISCPCHCLMMDDDDNNMVEYLVRHRGTPTPAEAKHAELVKAPFCQKRHKNLRDRKEKEKEKKGTK
ncbi:riboflavin-binding protein-like isoform X2 [Carcharodon carcharias]|uniref:riboflavin-binding protein-like isoform X2 n=1 Tax=Carcharodon carcharias TaxID=13397 RepID=UPI001B7E1C5A|nr:riboflavin-binding protein-like isoform X2 [Carcharodon carcharias]